MLMVLSTPLEWSKEYGVTGDKSRIGTIYEKYKAEFLGVVLELKH